MSVIGVMTWFVLAVAAMQHAVGCAQAQNYPVKPMRVAVGFPAGGPADTMLRIIGRKMTELSGQSVIVENRPGAIAVICAGTSDLPVAEEAAVTAEIMGNRVERIHTMIDPTTSE